MTLPSTLEAPKAITNAATVLEERQADLRAAQASAHEAQVGVSAGRREDLLAAAAARDQHKSDPGAVHERQAREELEAAERNVEVERIRAGRAEEALQDALTQGAGSWLTAVTRAHESADTKLVKLLQEMRTAEARRGELRALATWLEQLQRTGRAPHKFHAGSGVTDLADPRSAGALMTSTELIDVLERYVGASTLGLAGNRRPSASARPPRPSAEPRKSERRAPRTRRSWARSARPARQRPVFRAASRFSEDSPQRAWAYALDAVPSASSPSRHASCQVAAPQAVAYARAGAGFSRGAPATSAPPLTSRSIASAVE